MKNLENIESAGSPLEKLDERISTLEKELGELKEERAKLVAQTGGPKIIEMPTGYLDNFERQELWQEFKGHADEKFSEHLQQVEEFRQEGVEVSYDVREASTEMFREMKKIFNIPDGVMFNDLPSTVRDQFIHMRQSLEEKNNVASANRGTFKLADRGF
jgi:predicted translin family RNA/ssDNA-binding protein